MSSRSHARRLAAVLTLVGVGVATLAMPQQTLAGWTESVNPQGSVNALTVPRPTITSCTVNGGLFPTVRLTWSPPSGYTRTDAYFGTLENVAGVPTIVELSSGVTTTTTLPYNSTFANSVLSGLFGGSKTVAFRLRQGTTNWYSQWSTATASVSILGFSQGCTINP